MNRINAFIYAQQWKLLNRLKYTSKMPLANSDRPRLMLRADNWSIEFALEHSFRLNGKRCAVHRMKAKVTSPNKREKNWIWPKLDSESQLFFATFKRVPNWNHNVVMLIIKIGNKCSSLLSSVHFGFGCWSTRLFFKSLIKLLSIWYWRFRFLSLDCS